MRLQIHHKITYAFVVITAVLFLIIYSYLNKTFTEYVYSTIETNLFRQLSLVKNFTELKSQEKKTSEFFWDDFAISLSKDLNVRVTIINSEGVVLGDSEVDPQNLRGLENHLERPEIQQAIKGRVGTSQRFSTTIQENLLYMAMPFGQETGNLRGFVRLAVSLKEIDRVIARMNRFLGVLFCFSFILAIFISYLASRWISKPLIGIADTARRISSGHFSSRVYVRSNDEVGDLAYSFNNMADQISQHIDEVSLGKMQLEAVFSSMVEGVLVVDKSGKIFLMNQAVKDLLHIEFDAIGKRPLEATSNADIQEMIQTCLLEPATQHSQEVALGLAGEKIIYVHASAVMRNGHADGAVLVFHDVTELRRLEKIRKDFVANVSHELRTPVSSIKGYAETLIDGALDDKEHAQDFVRTIYEEAERLAKLIEDVLELSAIESGKTKAEMKACRLADILRQVVSGLHLQAKELDIQIFIDDVDSQLCVRGDEASLFRMFLNLVENAVKYNKPHGEVRISARPHEEAFVEIQIKDTGIGIPYPDQSRIFERFYRVDKAHSRAMGSTGLGLSIVKHIVQIHGGTVMVESTIGLGSVFTLRLPVG